MYFDDSIFEYRNQKNGETLWGVISGIFQKTRTDSPPPSLIQPFLPFLYLSLYSFPFIFSCRLMFIMRHEPFCPFALNKGFLFLNG